MSDCALPTASSVTQPKALFSARDTGARALENVRKNLLQSKEDSNCPQAVRCTNLKLAGCTNVGVSAATSSSLSPGVPGSSRNANLSGQSTQIQGFALLGFQSLRRALLEFRGEKNGWGRTRIEDLGSLERRVGK